MQLYAFNEKNQVVSAILAIRGQNYYCLECRGCVRVRKGDHRHHHFFHLKPSASCRQCQKSAIHLQVQRALQHILPENKSAMETLFPQIGRIADVVWEEKKLIFEVQYSGIPAEEVKQRNKDYASLGYQVVWILHEHRFNKWKETAAERLLRAMPHYYTNIDAKGEGDIYDQLNVIIKGFRYRITGPFSVDLSRPTACRSQIFCQSIPQVLVNRLNQWPLYFSRDLIDRYLCNASELEKFYRQAIDYEKLEYRKKTFFRDCRNHLFRSYRILMQFLLEKACK